MSSDKRPTMSISLKPIGGSKEDRKYIMAGWERDGKLTSLAIDRKIKQLAVQWEDGSITRVQRDADGRWSHFVDVYDARAAVGAPASSKPAAAPAAAPKWDDNDIPF